MARLSETVSVNTNPLKVDGVEANIQSLHEEPIFTNQEILEWCRFRLRFLKGTF